MNIPADLLACLAVNAFDAFFAHLANNYWLGAAVVIWIAAAVAGVFYQIETWKYRRIMRRTADLRKKRLG